MVFISRFISLIIVIARIQLLEYMFSCMQKLKDWNRSISVGNFDPFMASLRRVLNVKTSRCPYLKKYISQLWITFLDGFQCARDTPTNNAPIQFTSWPLLYTQFSNRVLQINVHNRPQITRQSCHIKSSLTFDSASISSDPINPTYPPAFAQPITDRREKANSRAPRLRRRNPAQTRSPRLYLPKPPRPKYI